MTDVMTHRGPDDRGTYLAPGIALGARRLSIIDVSGGHQPLGNEDGSVWAVQNGELYNHLELRKELEEAGHHFRSRCDTEILPHLYEHHGPSFVEHLRGKFGLAVWDATRQRAVIARDRLGVKPLYYMRAGDLVLFASELKSLLASGLAEPDLDLVGIDAYLSLGFFPAPSTPLECIRKLLPGERLVVEDGELRLERYWRFPSPRPSPEPRSADDWTAGLLEVLDESVRLRLMSDVPLGAMLSGGLDSSLVVALMARHVSGSVKTFSVGFVEAGAANELSDAREIAARFGTEHHELELSLAEANVDLETLVWHLDEPLADLSSLGLLALSELATQSVTVALSGQGADELLGGYSRHRNAKIASWWLRLPEHVRSAALPAAAALSPRVRRAVPMLAAGNSVERQLAAFDQTPEDRRLLTRGALAELDGAAAREAVAERLSEGPPDPLAAMLYLDGQLGLADDMLHYFDRASMAHSLEVRVPFVDHVLVEYCAHVPTNLKMHRLTGKYLLRRAARGILPDRIIDKPKIGFFNAAVESWFRAQTEGVVPEYLLAPNPCFSDLLARDAVEELVTRDRGARSPKLDNLLLAVLMLEVWLRTFLPMTRAGYVQRDRVSITG
jgi:asparagine synthase (glutamine-hydrolysing)